MRQHTWVPSAVAKVPLFLAGLVVYIRSDSFPSINTSRTVDILWQYPEHNTGSHNMQPEVAEFTALPLFGSLPHPTPLTHRVWSWVKPRKVLAKSPWREFACRSLQSTHC